MKRILLTALAIMLLAAPVFASDLQKPLTFTWQDDNVKTLGYHWVLFMRGDGEEYDYTKPALTIQWEEGVTDYHTTGTFTITGTGGAKVMRYFVIRAVDASGNVSGDSNEVSKGFILPLNAVYSLTVE